MTQSFDAQIVPEPAYADEMSITGYENLKRRLTSDLRQRWRPPTDQRDSNVELILRRTGEAIDARTINSKDNPDQIAHWAIATALEVLRAGGMQRIQWFDLMLDGIRIPFMVFPQNGESTSTADSILAEHLERTRDLEELYINATVGMVRTQAAHIDQLMNRNNELSRVNMENSKIVMEAAHKAGSVEIEKIKVQAQVKHEELIDTKLFGLIDMGVSKALAEYSANQDAKRRGAGGGGGSPSPSSTSANASTAASEPAKTDGAAASAQEAGAPVRKPIEDFTIGEIASAATDKERSFWGALIRRIQARAVAAHKGEDPEKAADAQAPDPTTPEGIQKIIESDEAERAAARAKGEPPPDQT